MSIKVLDRKTGRIVSEKVFGDFWLRLFYENRAGRSILQKKLIQKALSRGYGLFQKSTLSRHSVDNFIHNFSINMENFEMPTGGFKNFNEFFIRKKKKGKTLFPQSPQEMGSPCDARLFASKVNFGKTLLSVKGKGVLLADLVEAEASSLEQFDGGWALTFRLCPVDYHRFHFVDSGTCEKTKKLGTRLHSVNPVSLERIPGVFLENERQVSTFVSEHFGKILIVEVGALCVGKIVQTYNPENSVKRGDEKGYFEFGASTQIMLLQKSIQIDEDILENSQNGIESLVEAGEKIASIKQK